MKYYLLLLLACCAVWGQAQICLGNSTQATAALFDPNWIYGCATGTSCSGGVQFTNLAACEPSTAMDPCAPAPTACGSATDGSDLWFKFYASATTATINVIQNTSYVAAIQAFAGTDVCASLSQIGCNVAGGPSSGVQLALSGLSAGEMYYFRVYGSSSNVSHRTGNYCFCGSAGLSNTPLALEMHLEADGDGATALLNWTVVDGASIDHFEIERGATPTAMEAAYSLAGDQQSMIAEYDWEDVDAPTGTNYYRIKAVDGNGAIEYSNIAEVVVAGKSQFHIASNPAHDILYVRAGEAFRGNILNLQGTVVAQQELIEGDNQVDVRLLPAGTYFLKNVGDGAVCRFAVMH